MVRFCHVLTWLTRKMEEGSNTAEELEDLNMKREFYRLSKDTYEDLYDTTGSPHETHSCLCGRDINTREKPVRSQELNSLYSSMDRQQSVKQQNKRQDRSENGMNKKQKKTPATAEKHVETTGEQRPVTEKGDGKAPSPPPSLCKTITKFQEIERTVVNLREKFQEQISQTAAFFTQQSIGDLLKEKKAIMKLLKDTVEWDLEQVHEFIGFGETVADK